MKILFVENVPLPLRRFLPDHEVSTIQGEGWVGVQNGEPIRRAEGRSDILILADKNLRYQQNLANRHIALIELPTNRWPLLAQLSDRIAAAVAQAKPGSYTLSDQLTPASAKPVTRKVDFSGVLRQAPAEDSEVATGFFLVPGLPVPKGAAPTEQPSGEIRFSAP